MVSLVIEERVFNVKKEYLCRMKVLRCHEIADQILIFIFFLTVFVGPCHHGMARPQVADGGTASNMEGSFEYIEKTVADNRQGVILQLGGWARP